MTEYTILLLVTDDNAILPPLTFAVHERHSNIASAVLSAGQHANKLTRSGDRVTAGVLAVYPTSGSYSGLDVRHISI